MVARAGGLSVTNKPLVSIVIPVYNGANYVGEAIESALAQTYGNVEVVVVNDGSADQGATRAVALEFGGSIQYIEKENGGVATALNTGIKAMRGSLFSWLSHDDLYKPDKVARQVDAFLNFGAECVVIGDFELMDSSGVTYQPMSAGGRNMVARPLDAVFCGLINGCALLVPRALFDRGGLFEPGLPTTQDYHLWYRIARLAPFVHCPHSDVRQRIHALQGSKLAAHIDEASRMFSNLVDSTPSEIMRAYDGSELAFLWRVHSILGASYPALSRYLQFRMDWLLRDFAYAIALPHGGDPTAAASHFGSFRQPPARTWVASSGDRSLSDQILGAYEHCLTDAVLFVGPEQLPNEAAVSAAIRGLVATASDVARPEPSSGRPLQTVLARRAALPDIAAACRDAALDWNRLADQLIVHVYPSGEPQSLRQKFSPGRLRGKSYVQLRDILASRVRGAIGNALVPDRLRKTLEGGARATFRAGSERAVADTLRALGQPRLPTILFLTHALGGGAHRHLNELTAALSGRANCIVACGGANGVALTHGAVHPDAGVVFGMPGRLKSLARVLERVGVDRADVHHTAGFENDAEALLQSLRVGYDVTLVDYHLIAKHPHLCFADGTFVGDDRLADRECGMLRAEPAPVLRKAERAIAISRDMAARIRSLYPDLPVVAARHWRESTSMRVRHVFAPSVWDSEPLRVLVAGWIVENKGKRIICEAARQARHRRLPLQFHVLGHMDLGDAERAEFGSALTLHGRFATERFSEMVGAIAPHVAWLPAQVPETWSYVLTDFIESTLPVASTSIGAITERCYERPYTWLLRLETDASTWVDLFLALHARNLEMPPIWPSIDHLPPGEDIYFDAYLAPAQHSRAHR
jgi:glycosyltransferase involved in cell wall biosynthesis